MITILMNHTKSPNTPYLLKHILKFFLVKKNTYKEAYKYGREQLKYILSIQPEKLTQKIK